MATGWLGEAKVLCFLSPGRITDIFCPKKVLKTPIFFGERILFFPIFFLSKYG